MDGSIASPLFHFAIIQAIRSCSSRGQGAFFHDRHVEVSAFSEDFLWTRATNERYFLQFQTLSYRGKAQEFISFSRFYFHRYILLKILQTKLFNRSDQGQARR